MQFRRSSNYAARRALSMAVVGALVGLSIWAIAAGGIRPLHAQEKSNANVVSIDNFMFGPMEMPVPVGTAVTWVNRDDVPHTVVSVDHQFKSQALDTDEKFSFTFQKAGTYEYFCSVHPKMVGKIFVK